MAAAPRLLPGAVIGVSRGVFDHYGVAVENDEVIHYTSGKSDISGGMEISRTSLARFLRDAGSFWRMSFPSEARMREILSARFDGISGPIIEALDGPVRTGVLIAATAGKALALSRILKSYRIYSPRETVARAESRLGEKKYNVAIRNCEHFAFWCKTGLSASQQVDALLYGGAELVGALLTGRMASHAERLVPVERRDALGGAGFFRRSAPIPAHALLPCVVPGSLPLTEP